MQKNAFSSRSDTLLLLIVISFSFYTIFLFFMQILRGEDYSTIARLGASKSDTIYAQRGEIFDRNYALPLVMNDESFTLKIIPAELPREKEDTVLYKLASIIGLDASEIKKKIPPSLRDNYQQIEISEFVEYKKIVHIAERKDEFPGVTWSAKPIRYYLANNSFSHILGYVGDITREELKLLYNQGYQNGDIVGKTGIERQYDMELRGKNGREYRTIDVHGKNVLLDDKIVEAPIAGNTLVLTIDKRLQELCEKALGNRIGSVVALKPSSGEILAMVSYPFFDANIFSRPGAGNEYMKLLSDPNNPLINRTINSSYPPASTFKTVLTYAALAERAIQTEKKIACPGEIEYGGRVFSCWTKKPGHGKVDLGEALGQSCDIYFWTLGRDYLGVEKIVEYAKSFGFGKISGIDLPNEMAGFIPTPQWKERKLHEKWMAGDTMNMSIGQGFTLVTPLQLANSYAMVANEGIVYRPHLLKEIRSSVDGSLIKAEMPQVIQSITGKKTDFMLVKEYLRGVATEGTARYVMTTPFAKIAGKTGTAEVGLPDRWHCWFAAFGPYDAPIEEQIVVVVMVEAVNKWEWWAPFATNIIYHGYYGNRTYEETIKELGIWQAFTVQERRE
jgi:penicillin-binding protein 2